MKIALVGYGKMGRAIERIARERGHEITVIIDENNIEEIGSEKFRQSDVAIEFTQPAVARDNYLKILEAEVPLVSGTTGWKGMDEVEALVKKLDGTFLWTSNFSVGVNIFFAVNRYLAKIMNRCPQYTPEMTEVHHVHKLDHPSGTAKTLAEGIVAEMGRLNGWTEDEVHTADKMLIRHERRGEVPGIHTVKWDSPMDSITLTHDAKSRDSFALGAVLAAEWVKGRKGVLTMEEMMEEIIKN